MSHLNPVGCHQPEMSPCGEWCVKMDTSHEPSYYLINRTCEDHPRVALQRDICHTTGASVYFSTEDSAQQAIESYVQYWQKRGEQVNVVAKVNAIDTESQVMEFV